jgi:RimJ/RimL family protein N-acetyltransferase
MASDDARHILGIFLNEELVGVIDFRFADPEPFDTRLGLILVADSYRRQGLGTWALRILAEWLRQATPSEALVLTVQAQDLAAQRFFRHAGFAFTGRAFRAETAAGSPRFLFMRQDLAI